MILPTMTTIEISNLITSEFAYTRNRVEGIIDRNYNHYRRAAMKTAGEVFFTPVEFDSPNGNHYVLLVNSKGKADFKKFGPIYQVLCIYRDNRNKLCVAHIIKNYTGVALYVSHFFERYAERFLGDSTLEKKEIIMKFFKRNPNSMSTPFKSSKYEGSSFSRFNDGSGIYVEDDNIILFKTFLSNDMLKGTEVVYNSVNTSRLNKYNQIVYPKAYNKEIK